MGIAEFLSTIPGLNINVCNKNIHVHLTNSSVLINGEDKGPEIRKAILDQIGLGKEGKSYPCDIIHKDLLEDFESLEKMVLENKASLKILKKSLSENRFEMILMARRVHLAIENNEPRAKISSLIKKMDKEYPRDGKKILNLISAGYFDTIIFPMIEFFEERDPGNCTRDFSDFLESILKFFPIAIFVNNDTLEETISEELNKRLRLKKIPHIKIHAIGQINILKVERVISKIREINDFPIDDNRFVTSRGLSGQMVTIRLNED